MLRKFKIEIIFTLLAFAALMLFAWHSKDALLIFGFGKSIDAKTALLQALSGRFWFWGLLILTPLPLIFALRKSTNAVLLSLGLLIVLFIAQALMIGLRGWTFPILEAAFGELNQKQFGFGFGATLYFSVLILWFSRALAQKGNFGGDVFIASLVGILTSLIILFTIYPVSTLLSQAFSAPIGETLLSATQSRFFHPKIWGLACLSSKASCGAAWNTLVLALTTATCCTLLGLAFALIATRTGFRYKKGLRLLTVLPIITPPFIISLGLILIFGRSGIINLGLQEYFGIDLGRWIYGFNGVVLAQVFSFTPTAFLVLIGVVQGVSPTFEEAAETLRTDKTRTFLKVTFPLMIPGLANAFLVSFVESLADFGNPLVLGGSFGVLSTEIFFAVVGAQADFGRAAMLALILLGFALAVFFIQRILTNKSFVTVTGKGDSGITRDLPKWVSRLAFTVALPWAGLTVFVYVLAISGGFVKVWGRDWTFTLSHFQRTFAIENGQFTGGAWSSFFTTLKLAAIAAPLTAGLGLLAAWLLTRQKFKGKTALEFALMLSFCVPGTVIGVAYILTYNIPPIEITGTALILVICFIFRNLPVGVRGGMAALSQIDKSLDEAAVVLKASTWRTLTTVVLPLLKPAIITALVYSFVRAITTVSAVVFLVSAKYELATVYIINRAINGDYGLSIAYSTVLIVMMMLAIGLIQFFVGTTRVRRET